MLRQIRLHLISKKLRKNIVPQQARKGLSSPEVENASRQKNSQGRIFCGETQKLFFGYRAVRHRKRDKEFSGELKWQKILRRPVSTKKRTRTNNEFAIRGGQMVSVAGQDLRVEIEEQRALVREAQKYLFKHSVL
jgi:hypothetical protein